MQKIDFMSINYKLETDDRSYIEAEKRLIKKIMAFMTMING